jgi:uncharacterized YccA/Bax inhibitor family protein
MCMQFKSIFTLRMLLIITIINYLAQIPYYLHNYYFPYRSAPTISAILLLGGTLVWFLIGYIGCIKRKSYGYKTLLTFLIVEALFYGKTLLSGTFIKQLHNHSLIINAVFVIGYISGITAGIYIWMLIRHRSSMLPTHPH